MTICFQKRKISHGHNLYYSSCSILVIKLTSALYKHRGLYRALKTKNFLQPAQRPIRVKKFHPRPIKPAQRPIRAEKFYPRPIKPTQRPIRVKKFHSRPIHAQRPLSGLKNTIFFRALRAPLPDSSPNRARRAFGGAPSNLLWSTPPPHPPRNYWAYVDMTGAERGALFRSDSDHLQSIRACGNEASRDLGLRHNHSTLSQYQG